MNFSPWITLWNISVVELEETMQSYVLLSCGQIKDESGGNVSKCIEFVGLTKVDHIPN